MKIVMVMALNDKNFKWLPRGRLRVKTIEVRCRLEYRSIMALCSCHEM